MTQFSATNTARTITLAITGASGAPYALRLLQCLLAENMRVYLMISDAARVVTATETDVQLPDDIEMTALTLCVNFGALAVKLCGFNTNDWLAPDVSC